MFPGFHLRHSLLTFFCDNFKKFFSLHRPSVIALVDLQVSPGSSPVSNLCQCISFYSLLSNSYTYTQTVRFSIHLHSFPHLPAFHVFVVKVRRKSFHPFFASYHFCDVNCLVSEEQNIHKSIIKMLLKRCSQSMAHPSVWDWESSTKQP